VTDPVELLDNTVVIVTTPGVLFARRGRAPPVVKVNEELVLAATFCSQVLNAGVFGRLKLKTASPVFTGAIAAFVGRTGSVIDEEYPVSVVTLIVIIGDPLASELKTADGALNETT
jgi:hypothetical protein